jgi:hypothetical protein
MAFLSINDILFVFLQFRYADCTDRVILIFGILFSMALGTCMPLNILVYGDVANPLFRGHLS